jgi:hypothetical protein
MTSANPEIIQPRDPNTLSNYQSWQTQHVTANLEIDFEGKRLWGSVVLRMKALRERTEERVVLDSRYVCLLYRGLLKLGTLDIWLCFSQNRVSID